MHVHLVKLVDNYIPKAMVLALLWFVIAWFSSSSTGTSLVVLTILVLAELGLYYDPLRY